MAKSSSSINEDVVRKLAEILNDTDLSEIEYEKGDCKIRVARQFTVQQVATVAAQPILAPQAPQPATVNETPVATDTAADISKHPGAVKSPMVGNAYLSAAPGADPFIRVGDTVKAGDSILIIEAMKVMNQIKAPKDGVIKQILVQDADPVEFDQVLVIIAD